MRFGFPLSIVFFLGMYAYVYGMEEGRRIGKRSDQNWQNHFDLAKNHYASSRVQDYPSFSGVGYLVSTSGILGTAALIAPDIVITAAHVLKNERDEPVPDPSDWSFKLPFHSGSGNQVDTFSISKIIIHPSWILRQMVEPPYGDGDRLGVDLALVFLERKVAGVQPYSLPYPEGDALLGQVVYFAGFGSLVDGENGVVDASNTSRVAGQNQVDRDIAQVQIDSIPSEQVGGVFAFDFDDPDLASNTLGSDSENIDHLGAGFSDPVPLELEASTAEGDSGGPVFAMTNGGWKLHGVVSYGTSDSTYGDVTVLTRLQTHLSWIEGYLPDWASASSLGIGSWIQSNWFGYLMPMQSGWFYHANLGWAFGSSNKEYSFWVWLDHLGWLWTTSQIYPFCHSHKTQNWMYLPTKDFSSMVPYFDYSLGDWFSYPR